MDELEWVRRLVNVDGWAESADGQRVWLQVTAKAVSPRETQCPPGTEETAQAPPE